MAYMFFQDPMLQFLRMLSESFQNNKWIIPDVTEKFNSITSFSYAVEPPQKDEITEILWHIQKLLGVVMEGTIRENEDYWYSFIRLMEVFSSRIFMACANDKNFGMEVNEHLFVIACNLEQNYAYFDKHDFAVQRGVEYSNFRGHDNRNLTPPKFSATKEQDILQAMEQEYLLPFHFRIEGSALINDGFLPLKVGAEMLTQGRSIIYDGSAPIQAIGLEMYVPWVQTDTKLHPVTLEGVSTVLHMWKPTEVRKLEESYKSEIAEYLRKFFHKVREEKGKSLADILVEDRVPIEVKVDPDKSEYDRLTGQIGRHKKEFGHVVVLLLRISRYNLLQEWKEQFLRDECVDVIVK